MSTGMHESLSKSVQRRRTGEKRFASLDEEGDWKTCAPGVGRRRCKPHVQEEHFVKKHRFLEARCEGKGMGAITFTYECEHCELFPAEDFLWWAPIMVNR